MISYAAAIADIRPDQPSVMAGFASQNQPVSEVHGSLQARIFALSDESQIILLISADSLAMPESMASRLSAFASEYFHRESHVVLGCTHTHFAPSILDSHYAQLAFDRICAAMETLEFHTGDLSFTFQKVFFDEVGKSRISGHPSDSIFLYLVTIYDHNERKYSLITYNCHPTILSEHNTYMTAEYPGLLLKMLRERHPGEHFTFFQSAAGDISTRFTRPSQDETGLKDLTDRLFQKILSLRQVPCQKYPLDHIAFRQVLLPVSRDLSPLDLSRIPSDISAREKQVFEESAGQVEKLRHSPDILKMLGDHMIISSVLLGSLTLVTAPAELFSSYIHALKTDRMNILICYANGYQPYMPGPDFDILTYETMLDTTDRDTKEKLMRLLHELS